MKILITGPESSGKTTLARSLATAISGMYIPEYAREYLQDKTVDQLTDLDEILAGQIRLEQEARPPSPIRPLVCDTGPVVIAVWSLEKFGQLTSSMQSALEQLSYDRVLLCYPDLPWEADPLRSHPLLKDRKKLYRQYEKILDEYSISSSVIRGVDRLQQAIAHVRSAPPRLHE